MTELHDFSFPIVVFASALVSFQGAKVDSH